MFRIHYNLKVWAEWNELGYQQPDSRKTSADPIIMQSQWEPRVMKMLEYEWIEEIDEQRRN